MRAVAAAPMMRGAAAALIWCLGQVSEARQTALPRPGPPVLWHVSDIQAHGRPAVSGRLLYALTRDHEVVGLDAESGVIWWRQPTGEPGEASRGSTLVVARSTVIAGDFNLVAFDRATGVPRWRFVPAIGYAPGMFLGPEAGGLVFAGSGAGVVYAVRAETGELAWSTKTTVNAATVFAPATDEQRVAFAYTEWARPAVGGVGLLDAATGRSLWRTPFPLGADPLIPAGAAGGPVIAGSTVIAVRSDGAIFGFDLRTGTIRWTLPSLATIPDMLRGPMPLPAAGTGVDFRPLTISGSTLVAGSLKGDVVAWDLPSRRERWHFLDPSLGSVAYAISSDTDAVYVPFGAGRQVALDIKTGLERWRTDVSHGSYIWPAVSDLQRVFIAGKGGVYAIRR